MWNRKFPLAHRLLTQRSQSTNSIARGRRPQQFVNSWNTNDRNVLQAQNRNYKTSSVQSLILETPTFQVYGSNTDVGKTVVTAAICREVVRSGKRAAYIKPLQTGIPLYALENNAEGDAAFVRGALKNDASKKLLTTATLFAWETAVSPHLAALKESRAVSDEQVIAKLHSKLMELQTGSSNQELILVETAGGVCSPSSSGANQADVYRGLRLPVVLVGDGKLGGISATISTLESLLLRGYDIAAVCIIETDDLGNLDALQATLKSLNIPGFSFPALPTPSTLPLEPWFVSQANNFERLTNTLQQFHKKRLDNLHTMRNEAAGIYWWPFTQHKTTMAKGSGQNNMTIIDSAYGDDFCVYKVNENGDQVLEPTLDACASWWTQGVGHGNSEIARSIAYAAARYGHVMFPENAHEPSFALSKKLLQTVGKNWASRVFFSDDGSTAVEVALKMGFRKYLRDRQLPDNGLHDQQLVVLAQKNCYHGDTLGVMNTAEPSVFNENQHPWYKPHAKFLEIPSIACINGQYKVSFPPEIGSSTSNSKEVFEHFDDMSDCFNIENRLQNSPLFTLYENYISDVFDQTESGQNLAIGCVLIEPILIGSGGMLVVDPVFQHLVVREAKVRNIPVIYDEVFSGWWRLGIRSGEELLGISPDIACYAKLLTGGVVPLAVTLATEKVFSTFSGDTKAEALLHGHSFTAHPIGCHAALTAINMFENHQMENTNNSNTLLRMYWSQNAVRDISKMSNVSRAYALGTVLCVELVANEVGYASTEAQAIIQNLRQDGVYARALGNVIYIMCSPLTSESYCDKYLQKLAKHLGLQKK